MRIRAGLVALVAALSATQLARAQPAGKTLWLSSEEAPGTPLFEQLQYDSTIRNASDKRPLDFVSDHLVVDGSGVKLVVRSKHKAAGYAVCLKLSGWDRAPGMWRSGCFRWFDGARHDQAILTADEADQITNLVIDLYDVSGLPSEWDGVSDPPGMLAHQYVVFPLARPHSGAAVAACVQCLRDHGAPPRRSAGHAPGPAGDARVPSQSAPPLGVPATISAVGRAVSDVRQTVDSAGRIVDKVDHVVDKVDHVVDKAEHLADKAEHLADKAEHLADKVLGDTSEVAVAGPGPSADVAVAATEAAATEAAELPGEAVSGAVEAAPEVIDVGVEGSEGIIETMLEMVAAIFGL